jgi:uncharacterized protein DUF4339
MQYFLAIDDTQVGPLSVAELAAVGMRPSTPVWRKGMPRWQRADSVAELRPFFSACDCEAGITAAPANHYAGSLDHFFHTR